MAKAKRTDATHSNALVMPQQCPSCPWGPNGLESTRLAQSATVAKSQHQPLCHHHELHGKPEVFVCRGGLQWLAEQAHAAGIIEAPTIEAWEARRQADGFPERQLTVKRNWSGRGFLTRQSVGVPTPKQEEQRKQQKQR